MWWKPSPAEKRRLDHLAERLEHQLDLFADLRRDLAETSHSVRQLDLDMGTLEDKFKALTGRVSVAKRNDRKPEPEPEPEKDLNQMIRDGELSI